MQKGLRLPKEEEALNQALESGLLGGRDLAGHAFNEVHHLLEFFVGGDLAFRNHDLAFIADNRTRERMELALFKLGVGGLDAGGDVFRSLRGHVGKLNHVDVRAAPNRGVVPLAVKHLLDFVRVVLLPAVHDAATAPAQTIMVINQYKAKGPLTSLLLSVVALDDAVALIGFGFASTIVTAMNGKGDRSLVLSILDPFYQVLISAVIGFVLALVMKVLLKWFKKHSNRICVILGMVALTYYLATLLKGSSLLACMCLGAVLTNIIHDSDDVVKVSEGFTPPIYMMFFVISGAGFDVSALKSIGFIGIIYVVVRVIGKMLGSYVSGKITHQPDKVCKWLGPTLMPQAGVALGLIAVASSMVPDYAPQLRTVILCSTFIYSIIGPGVAKFSLVKAGEIVLPDKKQKKVGA